ncbi:MAG: SDR family oxidoreductase [Calditrichia bacterium]|nr:SDR family oxidoreductase [Calditrichia bacterium]
MKIKGANILITGSAIRVGKVIALSLAKKGANVVIHYNKSEAEAYKTRAEVDSFNVNSLLIKADMGKVNEIKKMHELVIQQWGHLDVLINNAAIFYRTPLLESTEKDFDNFMDVNLKGPYMLSKLFAENMLERKNGKIINIADVAAKRPWPNYLPYAISKAGVVALTKGLARALAPHIMVNAIAPGTVAIAEDADPGMEKSLIEKTPLKRIGSTMDIANSIAFLIEGTDFINGEVLNVDGGRSLV